MLTLSILDTVQTLISETICEGETYTFDSQNLTTAGTYQATLTGANGCDSSVVLTLNVLPNVETPIAQAICAGDSYTFDGQTLTATGTYRDTMTAANGCDSVIVLTLNVLDTVQTPISQDICTGDSYNFNNQDLAVAGAYRDTMTAANGCDSFIVLTLNVIDVIETNLNEEICEGESYTFDGQALTTSGTYRDTTTAASGCDSITILTLDVMEKMETAISASICDGDSYAFDGQTLTATGTYQDTLTAAGGCDSIIILTLDVLQPVQTVLTEEICDGDSYTFDNQDLTIAGTYRDTLTAANSCDSIIVLTLNVVDEVTTALSAAICSDDTYIFDEQILTTTGVYIDTLTAASGCDSIITLTLTVNPSTTATVAYEGCENDGYSVTVGGTIYDENNPTGTEVLTNANGCDSTVTVNLVFNEQKASTITYEGCVEDGYEVVVNGIPYSENNPSGTEVLTAANGCDSIVTINLTFQPLSTNACGKFDLALEKSTDSTVVRLGDLVVYQIQVTNEGTVDAYNIGISDFIPTGMSLADENWTATGNVARFNTPIVFLPAGSDYNLYITLKVNDDFTGTSLRNIAEISTADDDNDPTNTPPTDEDSTPDEDPTNGDEDDDDDAIVTVVPENNDIFDLALIETLAPGQEGMVRPGEMVDFKITVFNQGTLPAETIEITQYLPEGLTLNVANTQGWTVVNDSTITITLNAGEELPAGGLAAGEMYMLFIQTVVSDDLSSGKLTARAEISDDGGNNDQDSTPDDDRTNDAGGIPNTSTDDVSDQTPPTDEDDEDPVQIMLLEFDLALTEELITEEPVAPGDEVTAKIKVFNQGDIPADNIKLFAYIPAGLSLADSEWTEMDDSTAMRTLTITGGLQPDEMTMVEIDFVIDEDFMEDILITYAEISDATDEEGNPVTDIDSTPDDDRTNDTGGEVDTNTDDQIFATPPVDEDDHDPVKIPVRQVFDLALEKCTDSTVVNLGDLVTYQIKITNEGTVDAYRINISDFIPNGMSLQDANWTATGNIARYNTPIAFLGTGAQTTIEITLQVNPTFTSSSLVNFAEISLADDDTNPTNTPPTDEDSTPDEDPTNEDEDDDDSAVVTVTPPDVLTDIFDLALIETLAPGQEGMVRPGETVNFKITVFNQGTLPAETIEITQYLPEGLTLNAANAQGWTAVNDSTITITLNAGDELPTGGLAAGEMYMVFIQTVVSEEVAMGKLTAHAEISDDGAQDDHDSTPDNDRTNDAGGEVNTSSDDRTDQVAPADEDDEDPVQIMLLEFDLALTEELITDGPIAPGDSVTTKIKVFNQGDISADSIKLFAYIPEGLNLADDAWMVMNDSTAMLTLTVADGNLPTGGLVADEMTMVTIDFIIDPSFTDTVLITFAEIGDATDENGNPVTDVDSTPDGDNTNDVGGEVNTPTDDEVDETAPTDEDDHDPAKIVVDQRFDLALEKSTDSTIVRLGDLVTYQIKVTNEGTIDAYRIGVTDFIPNGMSLQDGNWTASGDTARYNTPIAFLAAGQETTIDITLQVDAGFTSTSLVNIAEISAADDDTDPTNTPPTDEDSTPDEDPTNEDEDDDDPAVVTVLPPSGPTDIFDLAITETLAPGQEGMVRPGETVDFKITVFNQGNVAADTIKIMQYLPEGLTLNTANAQGWTNMDDSTAMLLLTAGNGLPVGGLVPGEMEMVMIQTVVSTTPSNNKLTAYAEISDDGVENTDIDSTPDDNRTNDVGGVPNTGTDDTTDQIPPTDEDDHDPVQIMLLEFDLALTEELITEGPITPGDSITTKVKVFNQGTIPADSIKLFAYIPAGLNLADDAWMTMNDSTAMRTLTVADGDIPTGGLVPDEMTMVTIDFIVDPSFMDTCLISYAEIGDATDENGQPVTDIDSTPDGDNTNDAGGEVNTTTDNEVDETAPTDEDDHDPVKILVDQRFDLALEKSTTATVVRWGDLVTYQIKITNEGTIDAYRIGVTDFLPTGMSLQDDQWTASGDTLRYNTPIAYLAAGQVETIDITLQVNNGVTSTSLVNTAEISSADDDEDPDNTPPTDEDSTPDEDPTNEDEDDDDSTVVTVLPPADEDPTKVFDLAIVQTLAPDQEGMVRPDEMVDFKITVFNQGNVAADTIKIMEYLPAGLTLNTANLQGWTSMDDSTAMILLTAGNGLPVGGLAPDSMVMVMIQTVVTTDAPTNKLTAYVEISEDGVNNEDVDSTPDEDRTNDTGGVPNTGSDDTVDQIPPTDEDDHDPVQIMLLEFDIATTIELITDETVMPGDSVTGKIKVFNQGDIPADNIKLFAYIPTGMSLADDAWTAMDDSTAMLTLTVTGGVLPDEMTMVTIDFMIDPDFMEECITVYTEIGGATDENGDTVTDVDSTPDDNRTNDAGGEVDTATDNEVNETPPTDEDDHDPMQVCVNQTFDLALKIELAPDQELEILNDDTVCFNITVINQGTQDAYDIGIVNYVPEGLIFDAGFNQGLGHNWQSDSTYVLPELPVGESAIIPIKFLSDVELLDSIIIDTAEIYFATNEDGSTVNTSDIDSQADEVNEDVIGGDNITNNDRGDEDDHDFVYVIPLMEVDPIGFIYADKTGKIIKGGTISVSAPPGGIVFMIEDGSDGMYQWFTNGVQGEYTMTYTHPDGLVMSPNCNPQTGVYDPTGRDGDATDMDGDATNGIIQLGTVDVTSDSLYLLNPTCGNNPYYLRFFLQSGDPIIDGNNLPIEESFIGSIVCDDTNGNGQPDAGELGIPNAPVYLYNCSDTLNPIDSTRTDALGKYAFDGLNAGNYMVQFTAPDGYRLPVDAVPMNVIAARNGFSECIALTTGECDTTTTVCMTACAKPVPTISASTIIEGESVTVSVTGGPDFIWSPNTGITDSATSTVTLQPTTSTTYSVKIEDTFGCSDTVSIPIQVTPLEEHFVRIANPCECTTASINGTPVFNDRITIYSRTPNENWTITENSGIYLAVGLAPVGTAFTAGGLVDGYYTYTLPIQHLDAAGYAGKFSNGTKTLEASNICFANQSCITTVVTTPDGTPGPPVTEEVLVIPPGSTPLIDTLANCAGTNFRSEGAEDNVLYKDTTARNNVLTVCAQNSWQSLKVTFTDFDLAAGDTLFVFDGKDTLQSKLIGKFSGAGVSQTGGWLASNCDPSINSDGCLTFQFKTNGDNAKGLGWRTNITCIDYNITLTPPNNLNAKLDCEDSYQVFDIRPATIKSDCGTIQDSQIVRIINGSGMVCIDTCLAGTDVIRDTFAIGSYLVQYKLKSDTAKTAQGILTVQGPSHVCNDELTIPLGSACGAMLTPDDLLENPCDTLTDTLYYFISIIGTDKNGNDKVLASGGGKGGNYPMVTKEMIDQCDGSVKAKIERRYYEGLNLTFCNNGPQTLSCETTVNLIDQLAPIFQTTAKVDTFKLCGAELTAEALGITPPIAIDNCDTVAVKFVNATILTDGGTCDTTRATLNWTATDACGNVGTLAQSVVILRPDAADVVRAPDVVLSCGEDTEATFNDFSKTKMPGIKIGKVVNGQLVPTDTVNLTTTDYVCGYILQKRDVRVDADCGSKVFRYWDIVDWCDPERGVNPLDTQFIELRDTLAPKFVADSLLPQSVVLDHYSCTFDVNQLVKPAATDNCSAVTVRLDSVFRIENSQPWGVPTSELAKLDCDSFLLRYVAEDACHEQLKNDTIAQIILIEDKTKPAVVCTDRINISLGRDAARIHYREIDQGSYDACGIATYEVSRDEVNWDTIVTVTCDDVHQEVKVYLRVSDRKGNQNTCWMTVNVEDKIAPICSDLPDVTGTCDEGHGDNLATTDANEDGKMSDNEWVDLTTDQANDWNTRYGNPVCSDNVTCIALVVEQQYQLIEKSCGIKQIKRRFRAVDWDGKGRVSNWSEQNILIEPKANWSITLPVDWQGSCGENVPVSNIFVTNGACDMMAYEVEEKVFTSVEETCLKVVRTFTIINWCTYEVGDPVVTIGRDENQHGMVTQSNIITSKHFEKASKLEYVQILKLTDETAPEVTVDAVDECIKDGDCQAVKTFAITAEDCTEAATRALRYSWTLSTNGQQLSRGETNSFEATVAANTPYEVVWKVTDNCGNSTIKRENYVFKDCKKPAPYCLHGLAVELMSTGMVQVWASDVERGSSDNCSSADKLRYRIWHNSLGDAPTNLSEVLALPEVITFNCNYLGVQDVHLYTLDEAGNWDFCTTYVDIQDNGNACENTETVDEMSLVSGTIMDWQQRTVEEVMVYASATEGSNNQMMTKTDGHYHFELPMYRNYTIQPEKDDNPLNGVSTFDLVLIAKHILGIEPFENPYQMIAADVNSSGTVTAFDMVQIRQVILNIYPTFSNGSSWKFVDAQYEFSTDSPMTEGYPETVQFGDLRTDEVANFVAIKLGDVDGNARPNSLVSSEDRTTRSTFEISVHDQYLEAGKTYQVAFKGEQLHEIQGYQFTLGYEDLSIVQLQGGVAGVENFGLHRLEEGMITTSWNQSSKQKPSTLLENNLSDTSSQFSETLFFVELTAQRDGKLSELLRLRNNPTSIEAYSQQGELMDVQLTFTTPVFAEPFELFQNQPNPFNDRTEIGFYLPGDSEVHLVLRDEIGRILGEYKAERKAGYNVIEVDGEQLTNGFIYYQLSTKFGTKSKKMLRLD
ncbi:MAG: SdrD B-like domain-containing protein [Bacteroidota bacterium]